MRGSFFLLVLLATVTVNLLWGDDKPAGVTPDRVIKPDEAACALCFCGPDNIVFDAGGNAYVTDSDHKRRFRVLKVSPEGKQLDEWKVFAAIDGHESGPEGIAIDSDGNIFVTDGGKLQVLKLSPAGKLLTALGETGPVFHDLGHVAIDSAGNIYVAEGGNNRIQKFAPNGKTLAVWLRPKGNGDDQWNMPETIATRPDGSLAVEDWGNRRVVVLSSDGQTLFSFGGLGQGPGQFANSSGLCVDREGNIFVADQKEHRIQKFDARGKYLSTIGNSGEDTLFGEGPGAIAIDAGGDLYAPDGLSIVKFSQAGKVLARWR